MASCLSRPKPELYQKPEPNQDCLLGVTQLLNLLIYPALLKPLFHFRQCFWTSVCIFHCVSVWMPANSFLWFDWSTLIIFYQTPPPWSNTCQRCTYPAVSQSVNQPTNQPTSRLTCDPFCHTLSQSTRETVNQPLSSWDILSLSSSTQASVSSPQGLPLSSRLIKWPGSLSLCTL